MQKRLIVVATIIFIVFSNCPSNSKLAGLQVGSVDLGVNSNSSNPLTYAQTFSQKFSSTPQIGISLHDFEAINLAIKNMVTKADALSPTRAQFSFNYDKSLWKRVKIGYWATDRSDISVGQGIANLGSISGGTRSTIIKFNKPIQNHDKSIVRAYLTGLIINSGSEIYVRVYDKGLTAKAVRINVMVGKKINVKKVYFSYLIFSPQKSPFASYGGGFNEKNFDGTKVYDIHKIIYPNPYVFFGFMGFKLSGSGPFGYTSNVDDNFLMKLSSSRNFDQLTVSYIVIGNSPSSSCSSCPGAFIYKNECLNNCPSGSYPFNYRDNGKGCRVCSQYYNFEVNSVGNGCSCRIGFEQKNGYCQKSQTFDDSFNDYFSLGFGDNSFIPEPLKQQTKSFSPQPQTQPQVEKPQTQQFVPKPTQPKIEIQKPQVQKQISKPIPKYISKDCSSIANTYWTGYRCACRVGFISENGICISASIQENSQIFRPAQFIYKISKLYTVVECHKSHEKVDGNTCVCLEGYDRATNGNCEHIQPVKPIECPPHSIYLNGQCVCSPGYTKKNIGCVKKCPVNSVDNGLGKCVCNSGYYYDNGVCKTGKSCPPYSTRNSAGSCTCIPGYTLYGEFCSRCPNGQVWVANENRCVVPCGINEQLNYQSKICECKEGYGKFQGSCKICPSHFFLKNGYCVSCPLESSYHAEKDQCICNNGLPLNQFGSCKSNCNSKQRFNPNTKQCQCIDGLGISNGQCIICPLGVDHKTKKCLNGCKVNEILHNNKCICKGGYGYNSNYICVDCSTLPGGFEIDGYCASCPSTYVYSGNSCICPSGTSQINGRCVASCESGQLIDTSGICYWCPLNQVPINGKCQCKPGYEKVGYFCELKCSPNQVLINGLCGQCALNTKYDEVLGVCSCEKGYYKNNYGFCEKSKLPPVTCSPGSYFDKDKGCVNCPSGCKTCENGQKCTSCIVNGYTPSGNQCLPKCGDGIIIYGVEECDDNNKNNNDGCSSFCKIEDEWNCYSTPSICERKFSAPACGNGKIQAGQSCDDRNTVSNDGCSNNCQKEDGYICTGEPSSCTKPPSASPTPQKGMKVVGDVLTNYNNVFVLIETDTIYRFSNEAEMKSFMKYSFPDSHTNPDSAYCNQQPAQPKIFQCLLIYSSGLPNFQFDIQFSYNKNGKAGFLQIQVDPLASGFGTRSLH